MKRLIAAAAVALVLPFAASAQDEDAQLRENVASDAIVIKANIDVSTLTDDQVKEMFTTLHDEELNDLEKQQKVEEIAGH